MEPAAPSRASDSTSFGVGAVFQPRSIALVGASPTSFWGRQMLANHARVGYDGPVAAINPKYDRIEDIDCYPSLSKMPFAPDVVQLLVHRDRVLELLEEAGSLACRAAVVYAIGLAEAGEEGRRLQDRYAAVARRSGMAMVGPNSVGAASFVHRSSVYFDVMARGVPGRVGLLSQSGAITKHLLNNHHGVRWSHVVSLGNEAVCGAADFLSYLVEDPHTTTVVAFLETVREPDRFFAECDRARSAGMSVLVVKPGRSEAGAKAALAHSGALSPPDRLLDARLRRHGVERFDSLDEVLQAALAAQASAPSGRRAAALSFSGGQIELILDEAAKHEITFPALQAATVERLRTVIPLELPIGNPVDFWGTPNLETAYETMLAALADDPGVDMVLGVADSNQEPAGIVGGEEFMLESALTVHARSGKPITMISPLGGGAEPSDVERLLAGDVPYLAGFSPAFRAIASVMPRDDVGAPDRTARPSEPGPVRDALRALGGRPSSGLRGLEVLRAAGIAVAQSIAASSEDEAAVAAREVGFPVVVKVGDTDALHKTESGGVVLDVRDEAATRAAARAVFAAGARSVLVQPYVEEAVELIVGLKRDAALGMFVLVGLGGIWTEVLDDVVIRPAGLRAGEAHAMLDELRGTALLSGVRGAAPVDRDAVVEVIERLDALGSLEAEELDAVDVNPVLAHAGGALAVDALVVPTGDA